MSAITLPPLDEDVEFTVVGIFPMSEFTFIGEGIDIDDPDFALKVDLLLDSTFDN